MQDSSKIRPTLVFGSAALALALGFGGGFAFQRGTASNTPQAARETALAPTKDAAVHADGVRYRIPVTDAQPQRGPSDALVTVVEWCDLRGDACRASDRLRQELLQEYAGKLRWAYRHLIDLTHFDESHHLHAFARGAFQLPDPDDPEKFWKVRELLLTLPGEGVPGEGELRRMAGEIDLEYDAIQKGINGKFYAGNLAVDSSFAVRYGVKQGPGLFVNGRPVVWTGEVSAKNATKKLIEEELAGASGLVESGVAKSAVYDTLTKDGLWMVNEDRSKRPLPRERTLMSQSRP